MAEIIISQAEADKLIKMPKSRLDDDAHGFPHPGEKVIINLQSTDGRERFIFDVSRGKINWQFTTQDSRIKLKRLYPTVDACQDTSVNGYG
ncbi:MAG TPA: hypothetical protein PL188_10865 [Candidatus Cloacimonadota bacterium]|nr:hypothetical protein [Candidatus Cloacimonadota bacterium]